MNEDSKRTTNAFIAIILIGVAIEAALAFGIGESKVDVITPAPTTGPVQQTSTTK